MNRVGIQSLSLVGVMFVAVLAIVQQARSGQEGDAAALNAQLKAIVQGASDQPPEDELESAAWDLLALELQSTPHTPATSPADPVVATATAAARAGVTDLKFLVATVPDPVDSTQSWQFDQNLAGLRQGIETRGYSLARHRLPVGKLSGGHRNWPGVLLFRNPSSSTQKSLLLLFLVPETPLEGIHVHAFRHAMRFVTAWLSASTPLSAELVAIVGPTFSGSADSLAQALGDIDFPSTVTEVRVLSGDASNFKNQAIVEGALRRGANAPRVTFRAFVHPNEAIDEAVTWFQKAIRLSGKTASITEGSVYGLDRSPEESANEHPGKDADEDGVDRGMIVATVPVGMAQLRGAKHASRHSTTFDHMLPGRLPLPLGDSARQPDDQVPIVRPETSTPYAELELRNLVESLVRERVVAVRIVLTDVRDRLLLIREIRNHAPNMMIFVIDGDLALSHSEQLPWTKGVVVVSTYSLFSAPSGAPRLFQFPNLGSEGTFNAAVAALWGKANGDWKHNAPATSFRQLPGTQCAAPPVWISIVGRDTAWPIAVRNVCDDTAEGERNSARASQQYMFKAQESSEGRVAIEPSTVTRAVVSVLAVAAALLIGVSNRFLRPSPTATWLAMTALAGGHGAFVQNGSWLGFAIGFSAPALALLYFLGRPKRDFVIVSAVLAAPTLLLQTMSHNDVLRPVFLRLESGVSPLVLMLVASALPTLLLGMACRFAFLRGGRQPGDAVGEVWQRTVRLVQKTAVGWGEDDRADLNWITRMQRTLFYLRPDYWVVVTGLVMLAWLTVFGASWPFAVSPFGMAYAGTVCLVILTAQASLTVSVVQFWAHWRVCSDLLRRMARHPVAAAYHKLPPELMPGGLFPRRPRLFELQAVFDAVDADDEARRDFRGDFSHRSHQRPRWFESRSWSRHLLPALDRVAAGQTLTGESMHVLAIVNVLTIRELLSRLNVSLLLIGASLATILVAFATAVFDGSHKLLALVWLDVLASIGVVMWAFVQMDRDEALSVLTRTQPGKVSWNFDLLQKVAVFVVLPLLALFVSQFPSLGVSVADFLRTMPSVR